MGVLIFAHPSKRVRPLGPSASQRSLSHARHRLGGTGCVGGTSVSHRVCAFARRHQRLRKTPSKSLAGSQSCLTIRSSGPPRVGTV
jgi:hypothetical protein